MRKFYSALLMSGDKAEDANVLFPFQKCHICLQGENIFLKQLSSTFWAIFLVILFWFADNLARGGTESLLPLLSHSLGSQHAFSGASPKLLWIRHRQYCDIGERKQQGKKKWKWEVFSRVFQDSRFSLKKKAEPTKHKPGGHIERIQKDFWFGLSLRGPLAS